MRKELTKDFGAEGFSEYVGSVFFTRYIFDRDILFLLNPFSDIMISPFDVFSVRVVTDILHEYEDGVAVSKDDGGIHLGAAEIGKEFVKPDSLPCSVAKTEVLGFHGRVGDDRLLLAAPTDWSVAETED